MGGMERALNDDPPPNWVICNIRLWAKPIGLGFWWVEAKDLDDNYRSRVIWGERRAGRLMMKWGKR